MPKKHIHLYDAVRLEYSVVRQLLMHHADLVLQVPLDQTLAGVHESPTELEFDVGGVITLAKEVVLHVGQYTDVPGRIPMGRLEMSWEPTDHATLFPMIDADLEVEPIDPQRTMVSLLGVYQPPLGIVGNAIDRIVLHRLAGQAFSRFFEHLLREIVRDVHRLGLTERPDLAKPTQLTGRA